jgi:HlyD family secretion protein
LQAPILFTIAQDLSRMQVEVSVDEADIGHVRVGQAATFTVDSFPGTSFHGQVHQVRKAGTEVSNVITYTVVVTADNFDLRLLPGMTANVTLIISQRDNAVKVANTALRFRPPGTPEGQPAAGGAGSRQARTERNVERLVRQIELTRDQQEKVRAIYGDIGQKIRDLRQQGMSRDELAPVIRQLRAGARPRIAALLNPEQLDKFRKIQAAREASPTRRGRVWVLDDDGKPASINVVYGISDGTSSEIVQGDLKPGQKVIVGTLEQPSTGSRTRWRFGF